MMRNDDPPKIIHSESSEETKAIDHMIDVDIDSWVEGQKIHEVPQVTEGLGEEQ